MAETVEKEKKAIGEVSADKLFSVIEEQARDGVDFMTIHCGITRATLDTLKKDPRQMGVVSRGGSFTFAGG